MRKLVFIFVLIRIGFQWSYAQNTPPEIFVEGLQNYCAGVPMPIVTDVTITDADPGDTTLNVVFIQISGGFTVNQDLLILNGTYPNITSSWNATEGKLTLQGPATFDEFEEAIRNVTFETVQTNFTADKEFSINLGDANFLPATGHYYLYVASDGITWNGAREASENTFYFGLQGYLATITSQEEAQFAGEQSPGTGWIGASDFGSEGTWRWVTGPEENLVFWEGGVTGAPVAGQFSFWNAGEPNNFGDEDFAHITDPSIGNLGSWNDLPNAGDPEGPASPYYPRGYFVEFGGMPGDPDINLSAGSTIITPKLTFESDVACADGITSLSLTSNTPTVLWFETEDSTDILNTGTSYEVSLTGNTIFWIMPLFDGCTESSRIPFSVTYLPSPATQDITIEQCDDAIQDGLSLFNLEIYEAEVADGIESNRIVTFYESSDLSDLIEGDFYNNITNPQTIYAEVLDTTTGCTSTAEVTLEVASMVLGSFTLEGCDTTGNTGRIIWDLSLAIPIILEGLPPFYEVTFYGSYEDALLEDNALVNNFFNPEPYFYTIFYRVEEYGDCFAIGELDLVVNPLPNALNEETLLYCLNNFPETITLSGGIIDDVPNNYYYNWSTGETTIDIEVNEVGVYTVEISFVDGCSRTKTITVLPSNVATFEGFEVTDLSENNVITVLVSGEGTYEYALDNIEGPYQESNVFENVPSGIYTVYVRDIKNDCGISSEQVSVIGYPKFFTPNGDGANDFWQLKGISDQFQPNSKIFIFDRYGKLLYTLNSPIDQWDGTFNGQSLPTSDYWFAATLQDGRSFRGHFTLKR